MHASVYGSQMGTPRPVYTLLSSLVVAGVSACATPDEEASLRAEDIFDEAVIRNYELTLPEEAWLSLQENALDEEYTPAQLTLEGETIDNIGLRFKGAIGSLRLCFSGGEQVCDKLNLKLKFSEYDPEKRLAGLKRLNLHAMEADPTRMREAIGYGLFREAGVMAPRVAYARVTVNGVSQGLYAVVEAIDGRFTRDRFPDGGEGNLYKEVWPVHSEAQPYFDALKTNEDENPSVDKIQRFANALASASDEEFVSTLASWTDIGHLVRYMAIARLIDHWDGTVAFYCLGAGCLNHNYYWYESLADDKLWLIPWDLDHTFEEPSPIRTYYGMPDWDELDAPCEPVQIFLGIAGMPPSCDPILSRMADLLWTEYARESELLIADAFSQAALETRIDALHELLADEIEADTVTVQTRADWDQAVEALRGDLALKRAHVADKL